MRDMHTVEVFLVIYGINIRAAQTPRVVCASLTEHVYTFTSSKHERIRHAHSKACSRISTYSLQAPTKRGSQTCRAPTSTLLRITLHIARALGPRLIRRSLSLPLSRIEAPSVVDLLIVLTRQQHQPLLTGLLTERWVRIPRPQHGTGWQQVFGTLGALISQTIRSTHTTRPGAQISACPPPSPGL